MWEVDPETKSKLLSLQKLPTNTTCADCSAPSPQWASPKFGTFICLTCAGLHRGLGVHISFVRSITMDGFKKSEILRMERGGNGSWRGFWEKRTGETWGKGPGDGGERAGKGEFERRYGGVVGEEWKERLTCKVEGREFDEGAWRKDVEERRKAAAAAAMESALDGGSGAGMMGKNQKEMNEDFFARKGNENERRRADLPPSQGGKYGGFGSAPTPPTSRGEGESKGIPGVDEFQKDPVAALTKGFGWFTTTVGKSAKSVNDGWIQPNVQKLQEADLATQARLTAAQVAHTVQTSSKTAAEHFNRFVEDSSAPAALSSSSHSASNSHAHPTTNASARANKVDPEHQDFWDSFGAPTSNNDDHDVTKPEKGGTRTAAVGGSGRNSPARGNAIGTAAMRKGAREKEKEEDRWEDF
ncbi:MAG: hypothetical protein LQ352_003549 [Teloschistes flavicans]|nr:MAG: hypothetical protein LQ352_003549 [Teloschistes flavicans]